MLKYRSVRNADFIPDDHPEKAEILVFLEAIEPFSVYHKIRKRFKSCPHWELEQIKKFAKLLEGGYRSKNTLKSYIEVYGKFGKELYDSWVKSCELTPENFKKWNGDNWEEKWDEFRKKSASVSLDAFKRKFGEELGPIEYQKFCKKQSEKSHFNWEYHVSKGMSEEEAKALTHKLASNGTLENTIEKWGAEEGLKKYESRAIRQGYKITLDGYIKEWGEEEGWKKYRVVLSKRGKWGMTEAELEEFTLEDYIKSRSDFKVYCQVVLRYTARSSKKIPKPERTDFTNRGGVWTLDHKVSKYWGFRMNIPPCIIGSVYNLEYILMRDNSKKSKNNSMEIEELLTKFFTGENK